MKISMRQLKNRNLSFLISSIFLFSQVLFSFEMDENIKSVSRIDKEKFFTEDEKKLAVKYQDYYKINENSVKVVLKEVKEENFLETENTTNSNTINKDLDSVIVSIEKIVNIGRKLWDIVVANKPVSNIETKYAVAYPEGIKTPQELSNWKKPKTFIYGFYAENLYGIRVVDVEYKVVFTYGGDYKGKGKFLTGVSVIPTKVDVMMGYKFYMHCYVPDSTVVNVGTTKDPIAALQLKLTWKISTYIKDSTNTSVYYIQGDGYFQEIASPFDKAIEKSFIAPLMNEKNLEEIFEKEVR